MRYGVEDALHGAGYLNRRTIRRVLDGIEVDHITALASAANALDVSVVKLDRCADGCHAELALTVSHEGAQLLMDLINRRGG